MEETQNEPAIVSDPHGSITRDEEDLDAMISKASAPTLADLFQRGKDAGLIKPALEYASTTA